MEKGKVAVVFHGDGDGICSAVIICKFLESRGIDFELFSPRNVEPVEIPAGISRAFVLDLPAAVLRGFEGPVVNLDHHPRPGLPESKGLLVINPAFRGVKKPTSIIAYELFGGPAWAAYLGAISDGFRPRIKPEVPPAVLRSLIPVLNSLRATNLQIRAVKALNEKGIAALLSKEFISAYEKVEREKERIFKEGKLFELNGFKILEFSSELYISNYIASLLRKRYGRGVAVNITGDFAEIELRGPSELRLNRIAEFFGGGGHEAAAGLKLPVEKLQNFYRFLAGIEI